MLSLELIMVSTTQTKVIKQAKTGNHQYPEPFMQTKKPDYLKIPKTYYLI